MPAALLSSLRPPPACRLAPAVAGRSIERSLRRSSAKVYAGDGWRLFRPVGAAWRALPQPCWGPASRCPGGRRWRSRRLPPRWPPASPAFAAAGGRLSRCSRRGAGPVHCGGACREPPPWEALAAPYSTAAVVASCGHQVRPPDHLGAAFGRARRALRAVVAALDVVTAVRGWTRCWRGSTKRKPWLVPCARSRLPPGACCCAGRASTALCRAPSGRNCSAIRRPRLRRPAPRAAVDDVMTTRHPAPRPPRAAGPAPPRAGGGVARTPTPPWSRGAGTDVPDVVTDTMPPA